MASMRTHMRPLHTSLALFGLSHGSNSSLVEPAKAFDAKAKSKPPHLLSKVKKVYCVFVCCVLSLNVLRYIPSFWVGIDFVPHPTALRIVVLVWFIENAVSSIVLFVFFENKNHFERYVQQYITVISDDISKYLKTNPACQKAKRSMIRALVVGWIIVIFNAVTVGCLLFSNLTPDVTVTLCNPLSHKSIPVKIFISVLFLLLSGVWVFPVVLHYSLTTAIEIRFQELHEVIENTALEDCPNRFETLKCVRYKHLQLCKMVETVDQSLSYYVANVYLLSIGTACFLIYDLISKVSGDPNITQMVVSLFWLASSFIIPFIISIKSAKVHEKAHGLSSLIMDVNLDGATMQDLAHINLLVAKLHGPSIGLSVLGIITITKEMILTLAGVFMTYLFLLIQFKI